MADSLSTSNFDEDLVKRQKVQVITLILVWKPLLGLTNALLRSQQKLKQNLIFPGATLGFEPFDNTCTIEKYQHEWNICEDNTVPVGRHPILYV